ncbi:lasso peptide biosynthesis B2 protein [Streptomyces sp. NPDC059003]|uniref:lasso peptide biosynthesis B2 protein n=1 Tax=Streptomyces sp. NPDC059003 TaxID=3346691 RepID=UPI0036A91B81
MSTLVALPERVRLTRAEQITGHLAVGAAHLVTAALAARPERLRRLLAVLARRAAPATGDQAARARAVVTTLSPRCGSGYGCLPRSIATALLCRLSGTWPTWKSGVRFPPLTSHAWVEADGTPVGEDPPYIATFTTTLAVPPGGTP